MKTISLSLCAVMIGASAMALAPAPLKRTIKAGDTHSWKLSATVNMMGADMQFSANAKEVIKEVKADGSYVVSESMSNQVIDMGDGEMPAGEDTTAEVSRNNRGYITLIQGDDNSSDSYRFSNLAAFIYPENDVEVGHKWEYAVDANKTIGVPPVKFNFEIVGTEKVLDHDCYKIKYSVQETEGSMAASGAGHHYVDIKSGLIIRTEGTMNNAPMGGMQMNVKFKQELVK
ncbi:MAG: hypothetical protein R2688_09405 [Fimbriimonadaceae bacterium]